MGQRGARQERRAEGTKRGDVVKRDFPKPKIAQGQIGPRPRPIRADTNRADLIGRAKEKKAST